MPRLPCVSAHAALAAGIGGAAVLCEPLAGPLTLPILQLGSAIAIAAIGAHAVRDVARRHGAPTCHILRHATGAATRSRRNGLHAHLLSFTCRLAAGECAWRIGGALAAEWLAGRCAGDLLRSAIAARCNPFRGVFRVFAAVRSAASGASYIHALERAAREAALTHPTRPARLTPAAPAHAALAPG